MPADPPAPLLPPAPGLPATHVARAEAFLTRVRRWAEKRNDVRAVALVGSYARGAAQPSSDLDLVLLTARPSAYLEDTSWVSLFGLHGDVHFEDYGKVTSVRVHYDGDLELEFGIAPADWASTPLDAGTEGVARSGLVVLLDRDGEVTALAAAQGQAKPLPEAAAAQPATSSASIPRWLLPIVWALGLLLVHNALPVAVSWLGDRHGWANGDPGVWNLLGLAVIAAGLGGVVWTMAAHYGKAEPRVALEWTPPYLLSRGPYRFSRNPMYLAELLLWVGWGVLLGSLPVLVAAVLLWAVFHLRVVPREEAALEARFGESYRQYMQRVPRWLGSPGPRS